MGDFSLAGSALFAGVEKEELGPLLQKVGARERSFQRGRRSSPPGSGPGLWDWSWPGGSR